MQYEIVIKDDRWCSCYTCLPRTALAAAQTAPKTAAPGTGIGAPQMDQRLLTNTWQRNSEKTQGAQAILLRGSLASAVRWGGVAAAAHSGGTAGLRCCG